MCIWFWFLKFKKPKIGSKSDAKKCASDFDWISWLRFKFLQSTCFRCLCREIKGKYAKNTNFDSLLITQKYRFALLRWRIRLIYEDSDWSSRHSFIHGYGLFRFTCIQFSTWQHIFKICFLVLVQKAHKREHLYKT